MQVNVEKTSTPVHPETEQQEVEKPIKTKTEKSEAKETLSLKQKNKSKLLWVSFFTRFVIIVFATFYVVKQNNFTKKETQNLRNDKAFFENVPSGMVAVKGDTFEMGPGDRWGQDLEPVHSVKVNDFYIGKYEVTQKEWKAIMANNPSHFTGDNLPVEQVSWYGAVRFCNKLSEQESLQKCYIGDGDNIICDFSSNGYRLPTEAEWEYAARGGNLPNDLDLRDGKKNCYQYSGSNDITEVAWISGISRGYTHAVGRLKPNELGIFDMSGNVSEWCNDWYEESYYNTSPTNNPKGPISADSRVIRGENFDTIFGWGTVNECGLSYRRRLQPEKKRSHIGFRLVRSAT